ncbi:DNA polymerase III subunit [Arcticibacter eurypsychrophilus]|uniref:DNA polymerase III subunit n=1 Tax=Arcticibacter eurypsychrophilus TaxID=1434752 RepID=UPI00084D6243|nr:DNA polymerase III subunit delta' [Arcticibacter eurypsychrophilus]
MLFSEIVGQKEIKQQLIQTVVEQRVSHARLFLGPEGSGSLALALAYAQYISCENSSPEDSCGVCASCRKYSRLIHPDLHFSYPFFAKNKDETSLNYIQEWREAFLKNPYLNLDEWRHQLDAENKQANINIAECHQIIRKLSLKPFESEYKVLIMWLPEYLDKEGNTLLKVIEEPPQKTLFLLVAQNQDQILNTILSRTQLMKINRLSDEEVKHHLIDRMQVPELQASRIAYLSEGNLQMALQLSKEDNGNAFGDFTAWLRNSFANNMIALIDFSDAASKWGRENQKNFLRYGTKLLREVMMELSGADNLIHLPPNEKEFVDKFSRIATLAQTEALINEVEKAHYHIERNANAKILFLDVSLQFTRILKFKTLPKGTHYIYQ